jgi:digeranylgeranylglycerophospholipid reductase
MITHKERSAGNPVDAIVVGAGPVGCYAALNLAKLDVNVSVFEEHPQIGLPSHCAGHISIRSLRSVGLYPLPNGIVENTFRNANFYSPMGTKFSLHLNQPVTCALNRARFDQHLARQAQESGVHFKLDTRVQSLIHSDGSVRGVNIEQNGIQQKVGSKIVLDAEGVSSRLIRQAGLKTLKPEGLVYAVEAEVENVQDVELDAVEVYFGRNYAPGFYGWLIPKPDGTAKLGLATNYGNPQKYLKHLMTKHPIAKEQLSKAKIIQIRYHAITLGGPIKKAYANGFLALGDCASQVKPTTGGGVIFGLKCAKIAAETVNQALKQGDVTSEALQTYQKRCSDMLSFDIQVMLRFRRFLDSLSDEKGDEMLRFCRKLGVDRALSDVEEIDFQGKMIFTALRKPAMMAALAYFSLLYLSANP